MTAFVKHVLIMGCRLLVNNRGENNYVFNTGERPRIELQCEHQADEHTQKHIRSGSQERRSSTIGREQMS